jgi:signal peptidase I
MEQEATHTQRKRPLWFRLLVGAKPSRTFARIVIVIAAAFVLMKWVVAPIKVTGNSMEPTYKNGQINIINRLAYLRDQPQRGDIVAVQFAGPKAYLLKRIVGLPGETVEIKLGRIYINGERLEEPYARGLVPWKVKPDLLEPHQYMVIGDNRKISDFHFKYDYQIIGKVLF